MFDMNLLWESFIYWSLRRAIGSRDHISLKSQTKALFWQHQDGWSQRLKPDLVLSIDQGDSIKQFVIDTKWKYRTDVSIQDIRQLYAYLHYFESVEGYLLYPDQVPDSILIDKGSFWSRDGKGPSGLSCGLMFADLIDDGKLNREIGSMIVNILT